MVRTSEEVVLLVIAFAGGLIFGTRRNTGKRSLQKVLAVKGSSWKQCSHEYISVGHYSFLHDPETFRPHAMGCGMELACGTIDMTNDEFESRPFVHRDAAGEASIEVFLGRREGDTGDRRALVAG